MSVRSMFGPEWTVSPTGNGNEHHLFDSRGKVAATGYKAEKMQYIADCVNRIANLPRTADGVAVSPGMIVSAPGGDGLPHRQATVTAVYNIGEERDDGQYWASVRDSDDNDWIVPAAWCYSTPQAAEKASKA